jgi:hypothetical protein
MFQAWLDGEFRGVFLELTRILAGKRLALANLGFTHHGWNDYERRERVGRREI